MTCPGHVSAARSITTSAKLQENAMVGICWSFDRPSHTIFIMLSEISVLFVIVFEGFLIYNVRNILSINLL